MKITKYAFLILLLALVVFSFNNKETIDAEPDKTDGNKPNIILIMTDDQGHGDLGFHGNPDIQTPTLDSLATKSTRFTNFYVSPVCAPTRSSLMTGRYSLRTGVYDTYNGGAIMATSEYTIAEALAEAGYETGIFGKWHLGDTYPHRPTDQGFKEALVHGAGGIGQVGDVPNSFNWDSSYFDPVLIKNNKEFKSEGYCSDVFTDGAIDFIEKNKDKPFFTYLSFNAPHTPLQLPQMYDDMYRELTIDSSKYDNGKRSFPSMNAGNTNAARKVYGMVSNIDDNIKRLFTKVNELGIRENTIIIFLTDNGPQQVRYNTGFRGRKGSSYEGGIRVPFFISMPGKFEENKEIDTYAAHFDVMPTLLDIVNFENKKSEFDGKSLMPVIQGENPEWTTTRSIISYWQRGYDHPYQNIAVRKGKYKLVGNTGYNATIDQFELFDLESDRAELNNLVSEKENIALDLKEEFDTWYREIILEENLVNPPLILIGSPEENPVTLNRNDAKGPPGIWNQKDRYMYWDTEIVTDGYYDIEVTFVGEVSKGNISLRAGTVMLSLENEIEEGKSIHLKNVYLSKGKAKIDCWLRHRENWQVLEYPFTLTIHKRN